MSFLAEDEKPFAYRQRLTKKKITTPEEAKKLIETSITEPLEELRNLLAQSAFEGDVSKVLEINEEYALIQLQLQQLIFEAGTSVFEEYRMEPSLVLQTTESTAATVDDNQSEKSELSEGSLASPVAAFESDSMLPEAPEQETVQREVAEAIVKEEPPEADPVLAAVLEPLLPELKTVAPPIIALEPAVIKTEEPQQEEQITGKDSTNSVFDQLNNSVMIPQPIKIEPIDEEGYSFAQGAPIAIDTQLDDSTGSFTGMVDFSVVPLTAKVCGRKRRRGRPPKPKDPASNGPSLPKRPRGFQRKNTLPLEVVLPEASSSLAVPERKKPGRKVGWRKKKDESLNFPQVQLPASVPEPPTPGLPVVKKRPGRPFGWRKKKDDDDNDNDDPKWRLPVGSMGHFRKFLKGQEVHSADRPRRLCREERLKECMVLMPSELFASLFMDHI